MILLIPKVIHIGGIETHNLCGQIVEGSWKEKYLEDKVARTLPICGDCVETYQKIHGDEMVNRLLSRWNNPDDYVVEKVEAKVEVETKDTQTSEVRVMTLRQYLKS